MPPIEFTQSYQDLSTDVGFQFKFFCERCGKKLAPQAKFCGDCGNKVTA